MMRPSASRTPAILLAVLGCAALSLVAGAARADEVTPAAVSSASATSAAPDATVSGEPTAAAATSVPTTPATTLPATPLPTTTLPTTTPPATTLPATTPPATTPPATTPPATTLPTPTLPAGAPQAKPLTAVPRAVDGTPPVLGGLTFIPAAGDIATPMSARTVSTAAAKGCPAGTQGVIASMSGPGAWADGLNVTGYDNASVSTSADFTLQFQDTLLSLSQQYQATFAVGRYDVTLRCQDELGLSVYGTFTAPLWFTSETKFQSTDPSTSTTPTAVVVAVSPADRSDLGRPLTLTATVSPAVAGKVQFRTRVGSGYPPLGGARTLSGGVASLSVSLPFGMYEVSAVFTPADPAAYEPSTSADVLHVVALPVPPIPPAKAVISGTPKVGSTLTCVAAFTNATSMRWAWSRDGKPVPKATARTYKLVAADAGHRIACRASATNAGGTTSRTSAAVKVTR